MARESFIPLSVSPGLFAEVDCSRPFASLAVPLFGSLLQTYGAVWMICKTPWPRSLTWPSLFLTAGFFLVVTTFAHLFAVWFNRRVFQQHIDAPFSLLVFAIWPSVVWLPLLVLLVHEESVWTAFVLPVISFSAFVSLKRWFLPGRELATQPSAAPAAVFTLFHPQTPPPLVRVLAPALATSIALQGAVTEIALGSPCFAGSLFAACTLLPVWVTPVGLRPYRADRDTLSSIRDLTPRTLVVLLLLAIALIPFLRTPILLNAVEDLLGAHISSAARQAHSIGQAGAHAPGYSGIILTLPPKRQPRVVLSPPIAITVTSLRQKPTIIPFDGEYWYFKQPETRPDPRSPVVRGDPLRRNIFSTDAQPLSMEAHQRLSSPVLMSCCRSVRLAVRNAEPMPGPISVEILLQNTAAARGSFVSLGMQVIPSSQQPHAWTDHPADETLTFALPAHTRGKQFDEMTVIVRRPQLRARNGAHIAVSYFELVP